MDVNPVYFPYFRGKQFELLAIRESASVIGESNFVPIIEPVRESLGGLERALGALADANAHSVVVLNPRHGDHRSNGASITALLEKEHLDRGLVCAGILLTGDTSLSDAVELLSSRPEPGTTLIHAGFGDAQQLAQHIGSRMSEIRNVFVDDQTSLLYRRHFLQSKSLVLVSDGFERMRNADYQLVDSFSDLHVTYTMRGMTGYGDFLTVGDHFSEGGGPAYAVAIHLTFVDKSREEEMFIYHFVSDTNDTPVDPAGKFAQALDKLIRCLDQGDSGLIESSAVREFRDLHARGHFPGLGYVKKLSINHHLETLSHFHVSSRV